MMDTKTARQLLLDSFKVAVDAADPMRVLPAWLPPPPRGKTLVIGAGKAAARMAQAVEAHYAGPFSGAVVTRYGHSCPTRKLRVFEAGHPMPDDTGLHTAQSMLHQAGLLTPDDLLLVLLSGGGSSLWPLPLPGITLLDLRAVTNALLRSGARIEEINTVRKHLSAIQGGCLAAATRATVCVLTISDVTGDHPTHICSGPCAPDPTTYTEALDVFTHYGIVPPDAVLSLLRHGARGLLPETPKPGDPCFEKVENHIIASGLTSLKAAAAFFQHQDIPVVLLGDNVTGEAREVAVQQAEQIRELRRPCVLLSGGETTVTVTGNGRGGRNTEFLLSLALAFSNNPDSPHAIACGTDGIDGTENNAGALITPDTLARARQLGINPAQFLAQNDSFNFFAALGDLVFSGPTYTNVNDYRAILLG